MDLAERVAGRAVIVTGASSGLGAHFARLLARAGAHVVAAARRRDRLETLAAEIAADGGVLVAETCDVTRPADCEALARACVDRFGRLDALIDNAGTAATHAALDVDEAAWDDIVDTNLKGAFFAAKAAAAAMVELGTGGAIVTVGSILGERTGGRLTPYAVSKAGLAHMTRCLALEWARHRIRVNAVAPGYIETDLNRDFLSSDAGAALKARVPQRRFGRPEDLDAVLLLLAGDAAPYLTGAVIPVDGGHLVSSL